MNFLKKTFSPTILVISFLLFFYTFYKSEIFWLGGKRSYYLTYYFISSLLIFFSILTFFINQKIKEYLIITVISLLASLYLFEGYLTFKEKPSNKEFLYSKDLILKEKLFEKRTGKKWDKRSRFEIYNDLKKKNNKVVVSVGPEIYLKNNFSIFSLSAISNSETILCNENGYYAIYQSDRYGFNNPDTEWDKNKIEYILVGDSFTHGYCVNRPDDISSVLRTLSGKSTLNLGRLGNGPLNQYATLREYLNSNVRKVLWIYYEGNDLKDLENEMNNQILINYLNDLTFTQNLKLKQNDINILTKNFIKRYKDRDRNIDKEKLKFKLFKFIKIFNTRNLIFPPPPVPTPKLEFKKILQSTKELTEKNNSKLYFVYLPEYQRYKSNYNNKDYNLVKSIVSELNIPFIDIHKKVFEKEKNPLKLFPFGLYGHYNVEGYKKVGETIFQYTKD